MEQENFNALRLIEDMIHKTKRTYTDNGFVYLFWGYLVFISAGIHYVLMKMENPLAYLPWAVLMPIGGLVMVIWSIKENRREKQVKSYVDTLMKYIWIGFGAVLLIVLIRMPLLKLYTYPIIMLIYGLPTFITGGIFNFKPLMIGGMLCWVFGFIAFQMSFDNQLIWLMASILVAYIVPGHILKSEYKKLPL